MWIFGRKVAIHGLDYVIRQPNTLVFIMVIMYVISWGLIELSFLMAGGYDVRLYFFPFFSFSKRNNFSDRNVFMCSCVHVFMCVCRIFIYFLFRSKCVHDFHSHSLSFPISVDSLNINLLAKDEKFWIFCGWRCIQCFISPLCWIIMFTYVGHVQ